MISHAIFRLIEAMGLVLHFYEKWVRMHASGFNNELDKNVKSALSNAYNYPKFIFRQF